MHRFATGEETASLVTAAAQALVASDDIGADVLVRAFSGYERRLLEHGGLHGASRSQKAEWATNSIIADGIRRRGSAAVPALIATLSSGGELGQRSAFCWAVVLLGDIGDPTAIGPLEAAAASGAAHPMHGNLLDISDSLRKLGREGPSP